MASVEFTTDQRCITCGKSGMKARMTREHGEGSTMVLTCKHCGEKTVTKLNEDQAQALSRMARLPPLH